MSNIIPGGNFLTAPMYLTNNSGEGSDSGILCSLLPHLVQICGKFVAPSTTVLFDVPQGNIPHINPLYAFTQQLIDDFIEIEDIKTLLLTFFDTFNIPKEFMFKSGELEKIISGEFHTLRTLNIFTDVESAEYFDSIKISRYSGVAPLLGNTLYETVVYGHSSTASDQPPLMIQLVKSITTFDEGLTFVPAYGLICNLEKLK